MDRIDLSTQSFEISISSVSFVCRGNHHNFGPILSHQVDDNFFLQIFCCCEYDEMALRLPT